MLTPGETSNEAAIVEEQPDGAIDVLRSGGFHQAEGSPERSGFAGAVRTKQSGDPSGRCREVRAVDNLMSGEGDGDVSSSEYGVHTSDDIDQEHEKHRLSRQYFASAIWGRSPLIEQSAVLLAGLHGMNDGLGPVVPNKNNELK